MKMKVQNCVSMFKHLGHSGLTRSWNSKDSVCELSVDDIRICKTLSFRSHTSTLAPPHDTMLEWLSSGIENDHARKSVCSTLVNFVVAYNTSHIIQDNLVARWNLLIAIGNVRPREKRRAGTRLQILILYRRHCLVDFPGRCNFSFSWCRHDRCWDYRTLQHQDIDVANYSIALSNLSLLYWLYYIILFLNCPCQAAYEEYELGIMNHEMI